MRKHLTRGIASDRPVNYSTKQFLKTLFLIILLLISCCGGRQPHSNHSFLIIKDDLNRDVEFQLKPNRIISMAPSITETLFALDSGKSLIGVTDYCDYPEEAQRKRSIGGMTTPNFEIITELKPDLIIISVEGNNREDFIKLQNLRYKIFVTKPKDIEGIYKSIIDIGKIIGKDSSAKILVSTLRTRQDKIVKSNFNNSKIKILSVISLQPLISAGDETFLNELIVMAGGINIAKEAPGLYPILNRETVLKQNPDIIITMDDIVHNPSDILSFFPEWRKLNAFRNNQVFIVDGDLLSRPGPRIIKGLEILGKIISSRNSYKK
jgi:iron complex transport system substrate-binding protein